MTNTIIFSTVTTREVVEQYSHKGWNIQIIKGGKYTQDDIFSIAMSDSCIKTYKPASGRTIEDVQAEAERWVRILNSAGVRCLGLGDIDDKPLETAEIFAKEIDYCFLRKLGNSNHLSIDESIARQELARKVLEEYWA